MRHASTSRVTRIGVGLVMLIPVIGVAGSLIEALLGDTQGTAWILLGVGLLWILLIIWWGRRAPPARTQAASKPYWAALRHARFRPLNHSRDDELLGRTRERSRSG